MDIEKFTAYEILRDILRYWDIEDLYYFDFYKSTNTVRFGRKGYGYERHMNKKEFDNLLDVIKILELEWCVEIYEN